MNMAETLKWNENGLIPAITQDAKTGAILMMAWMNPESLQATVESGFAVYFSRSRQKLWKKGEESGHLQKIVSLRTDCDFDVILLTVEQTGLACHTGRKSCFFNEWQGEKWQAILPIIKNPEEIYQA